MKKWNGWIGKGRTPLLLVILMCLLLAGCGDEGKAQAPFNSEECVGMAFTDAEEALEAAGFTNIKTSEVGTTTAENDGIIVSVKIGDMERYSSGNKWATAAPVLVKLYRLERVEVDMSTEVSGEAGKPIFTIRTNLPDGAELSVVLEKEGAQIGSQTVKVKDGTAETEEFDDGGKPLEGDYTMRCALDMAEQSYGVKMKLGTKGDCLAGSLAAKDEETGGMCIRYEQSYTSDYTAPAPIPAIPQEDMDALMEETLEMAFGADYEVSLTGYVYTVNIWKDGAAMTATAAALGDQSAAAVWEDLTNSAANMSAALCELLAMNGHGDKFVTVNILNDANRDNILLTATMGFVSYNFVQEKK